MRPRKDVLLVMPNEADLGAWKMKLDLWGYRAHAYTNEVEALRHLDQWPVYAAATSLPKVAVAIRARIEDVLLFGVKTRDEVATRLFEPEGENLAARVRYAMKVLTTRKRGPAPLHGANALRAKPVQSVYALHAELLEQRRA